MSLIQLLVDFPNYSARRVRRLAKQIAFVQKAGAEFAMHEEVGISKGIESDLMEFNLLQAKTEAQLNDDVSMPVLLQETVIVTRTKNGKGASIEEEEIHRICVTPVDAARRVIDECRNWMFQNIDVTGLDFDAIEARCHGIINGQSFYTDKKIIQARLSPQEKLPLNGEAS